MEHIGVGAGDLARRVRQEVRRAKRVESIELARELRDRHQQELAFGARPFVLCGLPIRRPPAGSMKYTRRNGRFVLEVVAHPDYGLPFGQDRLIPLWVATQAVRQQSRTIVFDSAAEILREFGPPLDGPHYARLVAGFKRVFGSTIYFGDERRLGLGQVWDYRRFHFFDHLKVWWTRGTCDRDVDVPSARNAIVLSESFWREIQEHPIPVDLTVVRALAGNPGAMDFYMWIVWRCFVADGRTTIPLFGSNGLTTQVGVGDYTRERNFRKRVREWLKVVRVYWPECPAQFAENGLALLVGEGQALRNCRSRS